MSRLGKRMQLHRRVRVLITPDAAMRFMTAAYYCGVGAACVAATFMIPVLTVRFAIDLIKGKK